MRTFLAAVLAACVCLTASAAALARGPHGRCSIELTPSATQLPAGEAATLVGSLACPLPAEASEQTVAIFEHTAGTRGKTQVGEATTDATGAFQFTSDPLTGNSTFSVRVLRARSARSAIKVSALVTLEGPSTPLLVPAARHTRFGQQAGAGTAAAVFDGTVSPVEAGARVVLQRESDTAGEEWRRIGFATVGADGSYTITHSFARSGTATIRTIVRRHGEMPAVSEPLTYEIAQRQNPQLTLEASPGEIAFGASFALHGTLAGAGAGASVVLSARSGSQPFAPVGETTTDAEGKYEFPGQSPLLSTAYRVSAGRVRSAVRAESVMPLLSAEASATSIQPGTNVTFSGTLTPAHAGQLVHLQRENASGIGFHPIATTTLGEGSSGYSFSLALFGSGTQTFRITVPQAGGLAATDSTPLHVEVTPAPQPSPPAEAPPAEEPPAGEA